MNTTFEHKKKNMLLISCVVGIALLLIGSLLLGPSNPKALPESHVYISEIMNNNRSAFADEDGAFYDWVEITNGGSSAVDLGKLTLTDSLEEAEAFRFSSEVLQAGESLVIHLTGNSKENRPLHAPFGLSSSGDTVYLCGRKGTVIDSITIGQSEENLSFGKLGDKSVWFAKATPGYANTGIYGESPEQLRDNCYTGVRINEVCAVSRSSNVNVPHDWVELHNTTNAPLSLEGYRLTDAPENEGLRFSAVTIDADGFLVVACEDETLESTLLQAPFDINHFGETLYLYTPDGILCDRFETGSQRLGITSGRGNTLDSRLYFDTPTPLAQNLGGLQGFATAPTINRVGGYVESGTTVTLSVPTDSRVYYSTDGSSPTNRSTPYTAGTAIPLTKTTVLRAVAYRDGYLPSEVSTQTFLVTTPHELPVVSLSADNASLFGAGGIVTNYNKDLETTIHAEYFTEKGLKEVDFDSLISLSGGLNRSAVQKAFSLKLRQVAGVTSLSYPFFADTDVTEFSDLLLRPSGSDWKDAKLRDEFCATALKNTGGQLIQSATPVALYINGTYWGLYYLRERRNEAFVSSYTGIPEEYVQIAKTPSLFEHNVKPDPDMDALITYAMRNDLTQKEAYEYVLSQINKESLMRYFTIQTFFGNGDMINNIACYRDTRGGKWNWIIFDMDWACTAYYANHNFLEQLYLGTGKNTYQNYYYPLMTALLQNETFRAEFIEQYVQMMDTTLSAERLLPFLDTLSERIRPEIPRQATRFGAPSTARFEQQISYIRTFVTNRKNTMIRQLEKTFSVTLH